MHTIKNYYQVNDKIATSGQPTREQFQDIAKVGYEIVVNLALPTSTNAITDEGAIVTELGMTYVHIPVSWEAPKITTVYQFFKIMESFQNQKVWIHCAMNMRVSCFLYLFQKHVLKLSEERANYPMIEIWQPQGVWQELIQAVETEFKDKKDL